MSAAVESMGGTGSLKAFYDLQITKGCDASAARKNLARKIAAISLAVMKTGKPYEERLVNKNKENMI